MEKLTKPERRQVAPLFSGWEETMIWSCLQGYMGTAWCDRRGTPQSAQIITGDFCFFAGIPNLDLVRNIPADFPAKTILMVPPSFGWATMIEQVYRQRHTAFYRYAFAKDPSVFNHKNLRRLAASLPPGFERKTIDETLFHQVKQQEWSQDLCSQFPTYSTYQAHGIGIVALQNGVIASGASSYTYYDGGIEIQIDTHPQYRRMGLAQACASQLILDCLERSVYPSWDAANRASCLLAQKLGYRLQKRYLVYSVTLP